MIQHILERDVVVVTIAINNDTIAELQAADEYDRNITPVMEAFAESLTKRDKEIFLQANLFIVTEDEIFVGVYEDDLDDPNPNSEIPTYD